MKPREIDAPARVSLHRQHRRVDLLERLGRPPGAEPADLAFEEVIDQPDFLPVAFLASALERVRSVGCIRSGSRRIGTGFMVTPRLLLTNSHVVETVDEAAGCSVEFDFEENVGGGTRQSNVFKFDPTVFITSPPRRLDYTLIAVEPRSQGGAKLSEYDYIELVPTVGKALRGHSLNIVQHPQGRAKELVLRNNRLMAILPEFLHYETDTEPGSSGAPVFNDFWEVVCLHHRAIPADVREGKIYTRDGREWTSRDRSEVDWIGNEGIRISRIVHDVWRQADTRGLSAQLAGFPKPAALPANEEEMMTMDDSDASNTSSDDLQSPRQPSPSQTNAKTDAATVGGGEVTIEIPLRVTISVGKAALVGPAAVTGPIATPKHGNPPGAAQAGPVGLLAEPSLASLAKAARRALEEANVRTYYDEEKDEVDRDAYYDDIDPEGDDLRRRLAELLENTHETRLSYSVARVQHLYAWVDLQENKKVRSIYSNKEYEPLKFIDDDLTIERRHTANINERRRFESSLTEEAIDLFRMTLEISDPFNCEHVVPQSWFRRERVMQGDLHHLFSCESDCNSFRSNHEYADFGTFDVGDEKIRGSCGELRGDDFEPFMGKGKVARATLYFMLRYPGVAEAHYESAKVEMLLDWHKRYPVTRHEKHRNQAIFELQQNRNPLIDHPEWADRIFR